MREFCKEKHGLDYICKVVADEYVNKFFVSVYYS